MAIVKAMKEVLAKAPAPAVDPTALKLRTLFMNIQVMIAKLQFSGGEFDEFLKKVDAEIDEMKLSSPTGYARDGEFFRNRIKSRVKMAKTLRKFCEAEFLEDKEREGNKILLS